MSEERMVEKAYKWKPTLTRPLGRLKNKWEDDIRRRRRRRRRRRKRRRRM